jgi:sterol desaturase/sphingolipid hydroxylase (fatty acid hydroxylase superfamily)
MIEMASAVLTSIRGQAWHTLWVGLVLLIFELLMPASRYSLQSRVRGYLFWLAYIAFTASALVLFGRLWAKLGISPLLVLHPAELLDSRAEPLRFLGLAALGIAGAIFGDFFYYWFHRLQHASAFFWRFHSLHHSIREMSAINCYHHFTEEVFRIPFITIPMSLLVRFDSGPTPVIVATIISMIGLYIHSCTRFNFGFIRYVVSDNRFHRIHHSVEKQHLNKNFGSFSSLWDQIFGTAHFPKKDEWPETGMAHMKEPVTFKDFLFAPFLSSKR